MIGSAAKASSRFKSGFPTCTRGLSKLRLIVSHLRLATSVHAQEDQTFH